MIYTLFSALTPLVAHQNKQPAVTKQMCQSNKKNETDVPQHIIDKSLKIPRSTHSLQK